MSSIPVIRTVPVRFTVGAIGLVTEDNPYRFVERVANVGDEGRMIVEGPLPFKVPDGYVLVIATNEREAEVLYAPVAPSMVEVIR